MNWIIETLSATVDKELDALPADLGARFSRICQLIANIGLERVGTPHVKHLTGPLWKMRSGDGREYRGHFMFSGRTSVSL